MTVAIFMGQYTEFELRDVAVGCFLHISLKMYHYQSCNRPPTACGSYDLRPAEAYVAPRT